MLTNEAAEKYFGHANPIGKVIEISSYGQTVTAEVTAMVRSFPPASHFHFNCILSMQTFGDLTNMWSFHMFQTYVLLNSKVPAGSLEKKLPAFVNKYILNNPQADGKNDIHLQQLSDIHLRSHLTGEIDPNGDIAMIYLFAAVAIFILLIACFNFTNLSTARSMSRAKEVGLRKVVGAEKGQLLFQFLSESVFFAFIAMIAAMGLAYLLLPVFNQLSGKTLTIDVRHNFQLVILLIVLVIGVGLLAGLYPAVVLAGFKPVQVLKGKFTRTSKGNSFRQLLVTVQFIVSIILIASTVLVTRQLNFLRNRSVGYNKDNVAIVTMPGIEDSAKLTTFKNLLLQNKGIKSVAACSSVPSDRIPVNLVSTGGTDLHKAISMQMMFTDIDLPATLQMKLIAGRNFSQEITTDKAEAFIVNEEAVRKLGWRNEQEAIGKDIAWVNPDAVLKKGKVIGVVKDFNITPLKSAVKALVMHYRAARFQYMYIRFQQNQAATIIPAIQGYFNQVYQQQSFEYSFLDETLNNLYSTEQNPGTIFFWFSILAIVIACMGVLGLSLYSIQQRLKEIGIRKVLGASIPSISKELLKGYIKPVVIAACIASPVTWWGMQQWLKNFAYHIDIPWIIFVLVSLFVLILSMLTVGIQAVRAAMTNPVKTLRSE